MKHFIIAIAMLGSIVMLQSCIDEKFDIANLNSGEIAIGSDESEFLMPVANVKITYHDICQGVGVDEISIKDLYDEVSIWFPSTLPNNATYVDVNRLMNDQYYLDSIYNALYDELISDDEKRMSVCLYVVGNYKDELLDYIAQNSDPSIKNFLQQLETLSDEDAAKILSSLFVMYGADLKYLLYDVLMMDIDRLNLKDVDIDIPNLNVSEDVENLLTENLDPMTDQNPINALYLYGYVECDLPFRFLLKPQINNTKINFGDIYIDQGRVELGEIRIYKEDLQTIFNGSHFTMPIAVEYYYPYSEFKTDGEIKIYLSLRKTGGLKI